MLSRTTEYALRAVVVLARSPGENCTSQRIAEAAMVPDQYVSKVMGTLARAGIVTSRRGPLGGFSLAVPAERLSMLEVVEAVEPLPRITACPLKLAEHAGSLCPLHGMLARLVADVSATLGGTTIADLVVGGRESPGVAPRCGFPAEVGRPSSAPADAKRGPRNAVVRQSERPGPA